MYRFKRVVAFRFSRFVLVGIANTLINYSILNFSYYIIGQSKLVSGFIATSCAVMISFLLNRAFVFVDKEKPTRKFAVFLAVTGTGALLVQNVIYFIGISILQGLSANVASGFGGFGLSPDFVTINLSNFVASLVVMLWNYNGYRILVFNGTRQGDEITEEPEQKTT